MTQIIIEIVKPYIENCIYEYPKEGVLWLYAEHEIPDGDQHVISKGIINNTRIESVKFFFGDEYHKKAKQNADRPEKHLFPESLKSALDVQVGGDHYKSLVIQPIEYTHKNGLNFIQGNIIKYITRYKHKGGIKDLEKVKHYVDLLIELEYGNAANKT